MLTLNDGRAELWQWDTGRTLSVDADCSQVHFSNKVFGRSIDVDVTDGVAIIPDILLQTDKDLNVWAFVGTAENGYTKISKTFKVNRRNKPADYVFTKTEQMTLQTIQRQIGDLSDLTTEAKDTLVAAINEAARTGGGGGGSTVELDTTLTKSGKAADAAAVGNRLSALSEEKVSMPVDAGGTVQNGISGQILQSNGDGTTQWVDKPTGGSSEETANLNAYDAGAVKPFLRYDTFWDVVNPMFVTKHMNERATNNAVEIINDGATVHEVVGVLSPNSTRVYITYLKNIDGTTGDTGDTSESGRCKVYFKSAYNYYNNTDYKPTISTNEIELFAKGQELVDGTTIDTGGPACPTLYSDGSTLFAACLFAGNGCGGYVRTADISESPAPEDVVWSTAKPWTLSIDDIVGNFDMNRLNGWTDATWQTNNQIVWESSINMFIMAVCVNEKAVVLVKSSDGINWKYVNTIYTDYLCKFQCEAAVFRHMNSRIWIAVRNGNTDISTSKLACGNKNYLTIFKVSATGEKLEEYNIPDTGVKPWFIPAPPTTKHGAYLLHNAQSRYSIQIEYIDEYYPGMTLGEMYGVGTNYCCGVTKSSAALDTPIILMGTNGLVTEKAGASLVYDIRLGQYLDGSKSLGLVKKLITADVDTEVTLGSSNLVTSGAVFNATKNFEVPVATSNSVGGVKPVEKTAEMTQPVGIDETGALFVEPVTAEIPSGGGDGWEDIAELTIESSQTSFSVALSKTYKELELVLADVVASGTGELTVGIDNIGWDNNKLFSIANILSTSWIFGRFHVRNTIPKYFITVDYDVRGWSTNNSATANKAVQSGALLEFKGNLIIGSSTSGLTFESGRIIVRGKA